MPLLLLSFLSGGSQCSLTRLFAQHARLINVVGGLLLVNIGIYNLWTDYDLIVASLG